jgi:hypothetical protein
VDDWAQLAKRTTVMGATFMKTLLRFLVPGLVLLTQAFAQEPNLEHTGIKRERISVASELTVSTGSRERHIPLLQPETLPALNPPLGDIARQARAARASAPKAQVVLEKDSDKK